MRGIDGGGGGVHIAHEAAHRICAFFQPSAALFLRVGVKVDIYFKCDYMFHAAVFL